MNWENKQKYLIIFEFSDQNDLFFDSVRLLGYQEYFLFTEILNIDIICKSRN